VKGSISIVLFFLLSGFFLAVLLGAIEHSRKLLAIAGACFVAVACVIVLFTPVRLPSWSPGSGRGSNSTTTTSVAGSTAITTVGTTATTEAFGVQSH
jgi:hypothetical protein